MKDLDALLTWANEMPKIKEKIKDNKEIKKETLEACEAIEEILNEKEASPAVALLSCWLIIKTMLELVKAKEFEEKLKDFVLNLADEKKEGLH